jgi:hypothetical protein
MSSIDGTASEPVTSKRAAQIAQLEEKLRQLKAREQAVDARRRSLESRRRRKDDTRRKILVGGLAFDGLPDLPLQLGADAYSPTIDAAVSIGATLLERAQ